MLLTAYKGDARVPLAGIVKYTEKLQDAMQTHLSTNPTSGIYFFLFVDSYKWLMRFLIVDSVLHI